MKEGKLLSKQIYCNKKEIAKILGVSPNWIQARMIEDMPFLKLSERNLRFHISKVIAWFEKRFGVA